jgi:hypothetical protein
MSHSVSTRALTGLTGERHLRAMHASNAALTPGGRGWVDIRLSGYHSLSNRFAGSLCTDSGAGVFSALRPAFAHPVVCCRKCRTYRSLLFLACSRALPSSRRSRRRAFT